MCAYYAWHSFRPERNVRVPEKNQTTLFSHGSSPRQPETDPRRHQARPTGSATSPNSCTDDGPGPLPLEQSPSTSAPGHRAGGAGLASGASWPRSQASVAPPVLSVSASPRSPGSHTAQQQLQTTPCTCSGRRTPRRGWTPSGSSAPAATENKRGGERFVLWFIICFRCLMVTEMTRKTMSVPTTSASSADTPPYFGRQGSYGLGLGPSGSLWAPIT